MALSSRQLGFLFLLLVPGPAMAGFLAQLSIPSESREMLESALLGLVSGPLRGEDLLLVSDDHSQRLLDVGQVVVEAGTSLTPILLASQQSILNIAHPAHHTKGSLLTTLILFYNDPTAFLLLLENNKHWNPSYIVLFCLDQNLNTTTIVSLPVVQRSQFILLLQPVVQGGRQRLMAYTSLPTRHKAPLGTWNTEKFYNRESLFPKRFVDLANYTFTISVACYDQPFMYKDENGVCIGGNLDALKVIGNKYNFTPFPDLTENINWGTKVNNTWTGMLGNLMYADADIVVASMKLNVDRFNDFDFVYPFWRYYFAIIMLIPPPTPRWKNILYPFSTVTWGLVVASTVVAASALAVLVHRFDTHIDQVGIVLKVMSGMLGQAMDDRRVKVFTWARVWLIFWWLSVDILAAAYVSNLMSVLTVPVYPKRIQTLKELADSQIIPSLLDYGGIVPEALKKSENPVYSALSRKLYLDPLRVPNFFDNLVSGVKNNTHAIIDSIDYATYTRSLHNITRTSYVMDETLFPNHMTWLLKRNSPYTPLISTRLLRLVETGIMAKIYQVHMSTLTYPEAAPRGSGVLTLDHLQGAFFSLVMGLLLALLIFFLQEYRTRTPTTHTPTQH